MQWSNLMRTRRQSELFGGRRCRISRRPRRCRSSAGRAARCWTRWRMRSHRWRWWWRPRHRRASLSGRTWKIGILIFVITLFKFLSLTLLNQSCLYEPLSEGGRHRRCLKGVEGLGDDENVVDPDAEKDEGDDGVGGGVEQPAQRAEAISQHHTHEHAAHTGRWISFLEICFPTSWCPQWTTQSSAPRSSSCWASGWHRQTRGCSPPPVCPRPWRSDPRSRQRTVSGCWHRRSGRGGTSPSDPASLSGDPPARNCPHLSSRPGPRSRESWHQWCWLWCKTWPFKDNFKQFWLDNNDFGYLDSPGPHHLSPLIVTDVSQHWEKALVLYEDILFSFENKKFDVTCMKIWLVFLVLIVSRISCCVSLSILKSDHLLYVPWNEKLFGRDCIIIGWLSSNKKLKKI